jgi:hypothetical protein
VFVKIIYGQDLFRFIIGGYANSLFQSQRLVLSFRYICSVLRQLLCRGQRGAIIHSFPLRSSTDLTCAPCFAESGHRNTEQFFRCEPVASSQHAIQLGPVFDPAKVEWLVFFMFTTQKCVFLLGISSDQLSASFLYTIYSFKCVVFTFAQARGERHRRGSNQSILSCACGTQQQQTLPLHSH